MRAKLRRLHSPDVPDLEAHVPSDATKFGFLVQMLVGPDTGPGEESFDVIVCTPAWLAERYSEDRVVSLRHHILVQQYRYEDLESGLRRLVETVEGPTWNELAAKLARLGYWEFEDYRPG